MSYTLFPGRIAILVPERRDERIVLPRSVRDKWVQFGIVKRKGVSYVAAEGVVTALPPCPDPDMPELGARVLVSEKYGLIIDPNDMDIPTIGADVPQGHTLRVFGVGDPWQEHVFMAIESDDVVLPKSQPKLVLA